MDAIKDVHIESIHLQISDHKFKRKVSITDNARLDISAQGLWNSCEKIFFDVGITYSTS